MWGRAGRISGSFSGKRGRGTPCSAPSPAAWGPTSPDVCQKTPLVRLGKLMFRQERSGSFSKQVSDGWGMESLQPLRPPPVAETGSNCWGSGQQGASGVKRLLGAATRIHLREKAPGLRLPSAKRGNFFQKYKYKNRLLYENYNGQKRLLCNVLLNCDQSV